MSNKNCNYPGGQLKSLDGQVFVGDTVRSLLEMSKLGMPRTDEELTNRIDEYFQHCITTNHRPGIESLCLALSTTRQSFWNWCNGKSNKSQEWQEQCLQARQVIISFLESASTTGKINPATSIFLLKNWANYSDSSNVIIEDADSKTRTRDFYNLPMFQESEEQG